MKKLIVLFGLTMCFGNAVFAQYSTTPIMLSLPMDADTIEEDEPLFVWQTSLSTAESDPRLNLKLTVVQVNEDQTPAEAILENAPVFTRQNLLSTSINYSEVDHEIQEGVWYAWQVVLYYNGIQVQQSEVFTFIKATPPEFQPEFYMIRRKADNSYVTLINDKLYLCTKESGVFTTSAVLSGNGIQKTKVELVEVDSKAVQLTETSVATDTRYYLLDTKDLDLSDGTYRLQWNASEGINFIVFFEKK